MKNTYLLMFALYLLLFIALVFIDGYFAEDIRGNSGRTVESFKGYRENYMSIVPFKTSGRLLYAAKMNWISPKKPLLNIGGNLLLCTPFAFFLPLFFKRQHNFFIFFFTVSGVSVLVESIQLLTRRGFCDIDDLIFNVIGACVVHGLLHIAFLRKLTEKITKLQY
ncbi:MAG: VanZ family protein [Ruminococcus sp.]|nr:VanZ family protein [Ruminococcus sp.]